MVSQVILLVFILAFTNTGIAQDAPPAEESKMYDLNETEFNVYKEKVCKLLPNLGGESESITDWSDDMMEEDIYELALVNLGYGLSSDAIAHIPEKLGWKKAVIDMISYIAHTTCNTAAISGGFINAIKNLFLYYIIKLEKTIDKMAAASKDTEGRMGNNYTMESTWEEVIEALSECAADVTPIMFNEQCGLVHSFMGPHGESQPVGHTYEQFDNEFSPILANLDIIIDSMWWMFSISYARCYAHFYPNEDVILRYYQLFKMDFMLMFQNRWRRANGYQAHFDLVFGPLNAHDEHFNLRTCASAAYDYEGISGRQLVRPVTVEVNGLKNVKNFKISGGGSFTEM